MKFSTTLLLLVVLSTACTTTDVYIGEDVSSSSSSSMALSESFFSSLEATPPVLTTVQITPISHASMVLEWQDTVVYVDPVGSEEAYIGLPEPDIIALTDIHGDHLDVERITALARETTEIIAPQAVYDELTESLQERTVVLENTESITAQNILVEAVAMYNLPESDDTRHVKGRGNGYILERNGERIYISGDTADIPEMRSLEDIDIAFVCMNMPYTMDAQTAADAVLDFAPRQVYPYHYREPDGFADVSEFARLVEAGNPNIEVVQLDWYAE